MTSSTSTVGSGGTISQQLLDTMNGASSSSSASGASGASSTSGSNLQTTFLKLLVTQLQNQDPTNPMDNSQMTSQLAQINTVTGISQLNTTLTSLASQLSAGQNAQASLLIGQNVLVSGNNAIVSGGKSPGFGVAVDANLSDLKVTIKDSSGNVVNTIDLGAQQSGTVPVGWDGKNSAGTPVADGTYTISAVGVKSDGTPVTEKTFTGAQVMSVLQQSDGSAGLLLQNGSTVGMTNVAGIL